MLACSTAARSSPAAAAVARPGAPRCAPLLAAAPQHSTHHHHRCVAAPPHCHRTHLTDAPGDEDVQARCQRLWFRAYRRYGGRRDRRAYLALLSQFFDYTHAAVAVGICSSRGGGGGAVLLMRHDGRGMAALESAEDALRLFAADCAAGDAREAARVLRSVDDVTPYR